MRIPSRIRILGKSKLVYTSRVFLCQFLVNFMPILCQFQANRPLRNRSFFTSPPSPPLTMLKKCSIGTARLPLLSHGYIPIRGLILIHKYLFPFLFPFLTIPLKASNSISGFSLMYFFIFPIHELLKMISAHPCLSSVPITCLPRKTIVG